MKKVSMFLVITMLCMMFQFTGNLSYADVPYSGITIASGLSGAMGIAIGPDGKIYVSDYSGNKIVKMDKNGSNLTTVTTNVAQPIGIAFDNGGNLIVAEYAGHKIARFDSGGNKTIIKDTGLGQMSGIVVDSANKIFAVDYYNGKIYKMDADGSNSVVFVTVLNGASTVASSLIGMGIDANDNLYLADQRNNRILKIDSSGVQSDFANVTMPYWASVGMDGFVYASSINKTIQKFDLLGNKIETYSTGTYTPWGTQIDTNGGLYFVSAGATVNRIFGYAETMNRTHVKISLFYDMVSGVADPSAFTLNGVSSNPQVISAVVNGSEIDLTIDSNIESIDTTVKVSYTKTGTNNLVEQGTSNEIDAFSDLPVSNRIVSVANVETLSTIQVGNGTVLNAVGLPSTVSVFLSNSSQSTTSAVVVWDGGTPEYDGNVAGTYTFSGILNLENDIYNPENKKATVDVVVAESLTPTITTMHAIDAITVPNGTSLSAVALPSTASFSLSNSTTSSAVVVWDGGTPAYDGNAAGTYVFEGTINSSSDYTNPNNLKASVSVLVQPAIRNDEDEPSENVSSPPLENIIESAMVEVNGVKQKVSNEVRSFADGKSIVKVVIDDASMQKAIGALLNRSPDLQTSIRNLTTINVLDTTADSTVIGLNGDTVKQMDQNNFDILINAGNKTYRIRAEELTVDAIASRLSVSQDNLKSIQFFIQLDQFTAAEQTEIIQKVTDNNGKVIVPPTQFKVTAVVTRNNGTTETVEIDTFKQYVKRGFEISEGINAGDITTGVVFDQDGNYNPVPTRIYTENGKIYAEINSLSNSIYSVIYHPVTVSSAAGHWYESIVNDMASRLILIDYDHFNADQNVTRGEFATYMVKALGLYRGDADVNTAFTDILETDMHAVGVALASQWGLMSGYEDGTFKPNSRITREEAMVIFTKAMALANYEGVPGTSSFNVEDDESISSLSKPYIKMVLDGKVFVGRTNNDLALKQNLTHAEALAALRNLLIKAELTNEK